MDRVVYFLSSILLLCLHGDVVVKGIYVSFRRQQLQQFPNPSQYFNNVTQLSVQGNQISNIPAGALSDKSVLHWLDLITNSFLTFPNLCEIGDTLMSLHLSKNSINETTAEDFACLTALKILSMDSNLLITFPNLTHLSDSLSYLDVSNNPMVTFPEAALLPLASLENLIMKNISLNDTSLEHLGSPPNLKTIILMGNNLTQIPLMPCTNNLLSLNLAENLIEGINEAILGKYITLKLLNLDENPLKSFIQNRTLGLAVESLYLNSVPTLQNMSCDFLCAMPELYQLYLRYNKLTQWQCALDQTHHIKKIYVEGNSLSTIPEDFAFFASLEVFQINSGNLLTDYPDFAEMMGETIKTLAISPLGNVPDHVFSGNFPKLEFLSIVLSKTLTKVPLLGQMPKLKTLSLAHNALLSILPCDFIPFMPSLLELHVAYTKIKNIPNIMSLAPNLIGIVAYGTELICDCNVAWLKHHGIKPLTYTVICREPLAFRTLRFQHLTIANLTCSEDHEEFHGYQPTDKKYVSPEYSSLNMTVTVRSDLECASLCLVTTNCQGYKTGTLIVDNKEMATCEMFGNKCTMMGKSEPIKSLEYTLG